MGRSDGLSVFAAIKIDRADLAQREIFCCGPEPYMKAVREMLKDAGFQMAHYHEESFSFELLEAPVVAEVEAQVEGGSSASRDACRKLQDRIHEVGRTIDCRPDQFILDAAKAAGVRLPFSCSKGVCGTCKSKKLSGRS